MEQRVQFDAEKKSNVNANYKPKENMRTAYFTRKSDIRISHNGEMIKFLKLLSSDFCSRMISFCQRYPAWGVKF